jgi:hypothetical protein
VGIEESDFTSGFCISATVSERSGLGLEAQRDAVARFAVAEGFDIARSSGWRFAAAAVAAHPSRARPIAAGPPGGAAQTELWGPAKTQG